MTTEIGFDMASGPDKTVYNLVRVPGKPPRAFIVFDGDTLRLPPHWPAPLPDQMQGTKYEQLIEGAGRCCYESLGADADGKRKGRSSVAFHEHLVEVNHGSVHEHVNVHTLVPFHECSEKAILWSVVNRKGVFVSRLKQGMNITANLRCVYEWKENKSHDEDGYADETVRRYLTREAMKVAPTVTGFVLKNRGLEFRDFKNLFFTDRFDESVDVQRHSFASFFLHGSRGFTHEQVRHRFSMSQRSTRYVDESESDYIIHDLIGEFLHDQSVDSDRRRDLVTYFNQSRYHDVRAYNHIYNTMFTYLTGRGVDKATARKQARGAARGSLANALPSEMVFTASIHDWRGILRQRLHPAADAEIRGVYAEALHEFKNSRFSDMFTDMDFAPSPDGIGVVLKEAR